METPDRLIESRAERQESVKETGRLEAFSDGVFAVAITLLVFNIPIPHSFSGNVATAWGIVLQLWPQYLAYVLSFVTILIMWANHHLIFRLVRRTNQLFLMLNGVLLMFITFLNFPTGLLGASLASLQHVSDSEGPKVATLIYNGTLIVISVIFNLVWRYATYNDRLLDPQADRALVERIHHQYRFGPVYYAVPFLVAFPLWQLSIGLDIALAVYFSLTGSVRLLPERRRDRDQNGELMETPAIPR